MVEEYNESNGVEESTPQLLDDPYRVACRLVSGETQPEEVTSQQEEVIAELDAMLSTVHGGMRGTVQYQATRLRELMES